MRLSSKHVRDSTHHGSCQSARALMRRRLSTMVVLWRLLLLLLLGLVAGRKEIRRKLTDKFTTQTA